jgi:hypothetical protein
MQNYEGVNSNQKIKERLYIFIYQYIIYEY